MIAAAAAADSLELVGETSSERACERAGPGEATTETHPFHLHVNHFQARVRVVEKTKDNKREGAGTLVSWVKQFLLNNTALAVVHDLKID